MLFVSNYEGVAILDNEEVALNGTFVIITTIQYLR